MTKKLAIKNTSLKNKFLIHVSSGAKKFNRVLKTKNEFQITDDLFKVSFELLDLKQRIKFILSLLCDHSAEVSIRFCDLQEMHDMNSLYRHKFYATDVLSFAPDLQTLQHYSKHDPSVLYLGDLLICVPVCEWQARKNKITLSQEFEKMIIHGIVHLKGFDHERNQSAWNVMNTLEKSLKKELICKYRKPSWCGAQNMNLLAQRKK